MKKIVSVFILIILYSSCKIGNFMDISDRYNNPLYLYAQTANEIRIYEIDTENGTLSERGNTIPLTSEINNCNLLYESGKNNLFVSYGANPNYYLSGYSINDDGSLGILSGYPRSDFGVNPVEDYLFDNSRSFLYAITQGSIYSFLYGSDGSLSPTSIPSVGGVTTPLEGRGIEIYNGYLMKQDNADPNMFYSIDSGTGNLTAVSFTPALTINNSTPGALTVSNGYVYKIEGAVPNNIFAYSIDVGVTISQISNATFGSVSLSPNNAVVKDPESSFLYFVSETTLNTIYCIPTNTNGTIGTTIDEITTGDAPAAAAVDPYKQYFFTAGSDGGTGWQLNIHSMNGDFPSNSYNHLSIPDQAFELLAVRIYNN